MITLEHVYILTGAMGAAFALSSARDRSNPRRFANAAFWGLLAASFLFGSRIGDFANGLIALALIVVGGSGLMRRGHGETTTPQERQASAERRGDALFLPALFVPVAAFAGTLALPATGLVDARQVTLIALALGAVAALAGAMLWLRPPWRAPVEEGRRLIDAIGWAAVLPQMLAALGLLFKATGVGDEIGRLAADYLPLGTPFAAVAFYCLGMAAFTMVMGNAFAAFPVMTTAIGLPLIVHRYGGDPLVMSAIGMLAGFCGTLMTPMAANFNIVPAALLELPDRNGVIKAQIPTALTMLTANIALMALLVYRF